MNSMLSQSRVSNTSPHGCRGELMGSANEIREAGLTRTPDSPSPGERKTAGRQRPIGFEVLVALDWEP
jgi:hypothetical protein